MPVELWPPFRLLQLGPPGRRETLARLGLLGFQPSLTRQFKSIALSGQSRVMAQTRLLRLRCALSPKSMAQIAQALSIALD